MEAEKPAAREYGLLIGGHWRKEGEAAVAHNPYDGASVATVRRADAALMDAAIAAAHKAFETTRAMTAQQRVGVLERIAAGLRARADEIARTIVAEAGKPVTLARAEVASAIEALEIAAGEVRRSDGETFSLDVAERGEHAVGVTRRFPIGPVAAITPFSFPLRQPAEKVAAAIAVGNSIILRPSSLAPISALILGEIATEAGLPDGALGVTPSPAKQAEHLAADERIKLISFAGGSAAAWALKAKAGKKRVVLETGGSTAAILAPDADLDEAIAQLAAGAYAFAGQVPASVQRVFVERSLLDEFLEGFLRRVEREIGVGDPTDEGVLCGPMITKEEADRVEQWIEEAIRGGGKQVIGGRRQRNVLWPTVLTGVSPALKVNAMEVFGPVVTVAAYDLFDEALEMADSSRSELCAAVFTRDVHKIARAFERLEVRAVIANGLPQSQMMGLSPGGVRRIMREMTEPKSLVLNTE